MDVLVSELNCKDITFLKTHAFGKVATYKATVHKNGQLLIGSAYTRGMGLKEGDVFTIKLGYKHIHLIQED